MVTHCVDFGSLIRTTGYAPYVGVVCAFDWFAVTVPARTFVYPRCRTTLPFGLHATVLWFTPCRFVHAPVCFTFRSQFVDCTLHGCVPSVLRSNVGRSRFCVLITLRFFYYPFTVGSLLPVVLVVRLFAPLRFAHDCYCTALPHVRLRYTRIFYVLRDVVMPLITFV